MKVFVILLVLIGFVGFAHATEPEPVGVDMIEYGIFDPNDNNTHLLKVGTTYDIKAHFKSDLDKQVSFKFLVQIQDKDKHWTEPVDEFVRTGTLYPNESKQFSFSWTPQYQGEFRTYVEVSNPTTNTAIGYAPQFDFEVIQPNPDDPFYDYFPTYRIMNLKDKYQADEPMRPYILKKDLDACNAYRAEILKDDRRVWEYPYHSSCIMAERSFEIESEVQIPTTNESIKLSETGHYTLEVEIGNYELQENFSIIDSNEAASPLQQIQLGMLFDEIKCKENLVLLQKYDGSPACVTESTKQKLIERGWTGENNEKTVGLYTTGLEIRSTSSFVFNGTTDKPNIPISFDITNPQGTVISTLNKTADADGSFSVATTTGGPLWKKYDGLYTIIGKQSDSTDYEIKVKFELKDGRLVSDPTFYQIQNDIDLLKQNIRTMEDGRISLYPESTCASISLELLAEKDIQRYKNDERGLNATNVLPITADDFDEIPILEELIYAVNLLEFPYNEYSSAYLDGLTFVEYELFLMDKAIQKYGDSQDDYFIKLDKDYEERFSNPKKQGFSNTFETPLITYNNKTYSIGGTVFWTSDEHQPMRMTVKPFDEIKNGDKVIKLTDEDMKSIPKIKQAIKEIGTIKESIHGLKGVSEGTQNKYMQWLKEKSQERLGSDRFRLVEYDNQLYSISFPIC